MIDSMWILTLAGALLAATFGVLIAVLAWIGNKLHTKLEEITKSLTSIAGDLHNRINDHDRRITTVETIIEMADCKKPKAGQ
jgi:uncharacterized protein YoxC